MKFVLLCSSAGFAFGRNVVESNTLLQASKSRSISKDTHVSFQNSIPQAPANRPLPSHLSSEENGCIDTSGEPLVGVFEDCTYRDFYIYKGSVQDAKRIWQGTDPFIEPSYDVSSYGEDDWWKTAAVQDYDSGFFGADCVSYVDEHDAQPKDTCENWCGSRGMTCVAGMDDAHRVTRNLDAWLANAGYSQTNCTLLPAGHTRQNTADNGCKQQWTTQVCACDYTTTTTTPPCNPPQSVLFEERESCSAMIDATTRSAFTFEFEDCTHKKFFQYLESVPHSKRTAFVGASWLMHADNTSYVGGDALSQDTACGQDGNWGVVPVQRDDWAVGCVAYINKGRRNTFTCNDFCAEHGMVCNVAMDDAHFKTDDLNDWLGADATDCTLIPEGHSRQTGTLDNGCAQAWESQICGCSKVRPSSYAAGCNGFNLDVPNFVGEDCTHKDIFEYRGELGEVVAPKYDPTTYGADDKWMTHQAPSGGWLGASCVAYVHTGGDTCQDWCASQGKQCVMGWDDAGHQTDALDEWLTQAGQDTTRCTYSASATRQASGSSDNGCTHSWEAQMCACD